MKKITVDPISGRVRVQTVKSPDAKIRTQQQFKEQCDVNQIMKKYRATGEITHLARKEGVFADFSQIPNLHEAFHSVSMARDAMQALPALIRLRFENDPSQLLAFMQDSNNYDEGVKLGLYEPKKVPSQSPALNDDDSNDDKQAPATKATSSAKTKAKTHSTPAEPE